MMRPARTAHITTHHIEPGHTIIVRRVGGFDLWTVDEYVGGAGRELTTTATGGSCWYTQRHEAETLAEAYAAIRTCDAVDTNAVRDDDEIIERIAAGEETDRDQVARMLEAWVKDVRS